MENIKRYQQYLLFYHSLNKIFLKIAPKPIPLRHWLTFSLLYLYLTYLIFEFKLEFELSLFAKKMNINNIFP